MRLCGFQSRLSKSRSWSFHGLLTTAAVLLVLVPQICLRDYGIFVVVPDFNYTYIASACLPKSELRLSVWLATRCQRQR
jgi:hypothetical protein